MTHFCTGHLKQRELIAELIQSGKLPHALLLTGERGIGKATFAQDLLMHLIAPKSSGILEHDPLHSEILQLNEGAYPHYFEIKPEEGKKNISVDQIRKAIGELQFKHDKWQILLIDSADDLNVNAANALLKTLEEPNAKTLIILISHAPYKLLPTIKSRCQAVHFNKLTEEETEQVLSAHEIVDREALPDALRVCEGKPGEALNYLENEHPVFVKFADYLEAYFKGQVLAVEVDKLIGRQDATTAFKALQMFVAQVVKSHNSGALMGLPKIYDKLLKYIKQNEALGFAKLYQDLEKIREESYIYNINPQLMLEKSLSMLQPYIQKAK